MHLAIIMNDPRRKAALKSLRNGKFEAVEKILEQALKRTGLAQDIARYKFVLHWDEIVGAEIAKRAKPDSVRKGILFVKVSNSAWAQELTFQKDIILKRLNNYVSDENPVHDVRFYVGSSL